MALLHCDFFSETLGLGSSISVILPQRSMAAARKKPQAKYPTLYLFHGLSDDHTAWLRQTSIERYVERLNLAVVMPAVHRSFYTDMAHGGRYWSYISEELPTLAQSFFPLSASRKDNFVAGLSMGGYGAFKLALTHPNRYAAAASLSGALDAVSMIASEEEGWREEMINIFGKLKRLPNGPNDLFHLARQLATRKRRPRLYQCCGLQDLLHDDNIRFRDLALSLDLDLTYDEGPGEHDWAYWDLQIQKVLAWLPLG